MANLKFFTCEQCGNILEMVVSADSDVCCVEGLKELIPGTTDAATEKHVPVVSVEGNKVHVEVGSVSHPMAEEHSIQFIAIETSHGSQRKNLNPGEASSADFTLVDGEEFIAAYEYCNLHGLWKNN